MRGGVIGIVELSLKQSVELAGRSQPSLLNFL